MIHKVKNDFLKQCLSEMGQMPLDQFQAAFCVRCLNQECSRSSSNNHLFVQRTATWQQRLFTEVSRAADDDPRYAELRSKTFPSSTPSLGNITTQPTAHFISKEPETMQTVVMPKFKVGEGAINPRGIQPEEPEEKREPVPAPVPNTGVHNTPFEQGTILPGGEAQEKTIEPGGTVYFDDE